MAPRSLHLRALDLTPRQRDVLVATANGQTTAVIARTLGVATSTVGTDRLAAERTLGARDITHTVVLAIAAGAIDIDGSGKAH